MRITTDTGRGTGTGTGTGGAAPAPLWRRLLWFVGLWAGGVAAVAGVGYAIRLALRG